MTRVEAYHILGKMWEDATTEQAEAISMAQNDIEFVDLMPDDMVAVVRCKDCRWSRTNQKDDADVYYCELRTGRAYHSGDFCSLGERKDGDT